MQLEVTKAEYCANMPKNLINVGRFITSSQAATSLGEYLKSINATSSTPHLVLGHTFGLNRLNTLLDNIAKFNAGLGEGDRAIHAVRVYYGLSQRNDPDFPMDPTDGIFPDVMFVPVYEDGNDIEAIMGGVDDPELILSESRPCPNECGYTFS